MAFKGNVESFSLADVFQNLAMNNQTGTLRITPEKDHGTEETYVYFQDGAVRFLSHSSRAPLLPPEVFMARGLVSKSEFDAALIRQAEATQTIVTSLTELGYVNEQQVQELLLHQIAEGIYDLFGWETAAFEFNEGPPPEGLFAAEAAEAGWGVSIQVAHLIMEAARRVDEWERLRRIIPTPREIFVVDLTVRKAIERGEMETDPVERRVAMLVDGARDVGDIIEDSQFFKFEVYGALAGFLQSSVIRPATLNELNFSEGECARNDLSRRRIKVLERILALGGENLRIRQELAGLMAKMGQTEHACIHYSILAASELKEGREEGAIEIYKNILALVPANVKTRQALAELYAKRGQKRDAFVQYQELFENLRDQHQLREARDAATHALENDPSNSKLRNALVELLLMDDRHEEASFQLETLGDYSARSRNTAVAADAYRRAMQYRKNSRPLKKKLNEVLLTKEDRAARRRRAVLSVAFILLVGLGMGALAWYENDNYTRYQGVVKSSQPDLEEATRLEKDQKYPEAIARIDRSIQKLAAFSKMWSPLIKVNDKAEIKIGELRRRVEGIKQFDKSMTVVNRSRRDEARQKAARLSRNNNDYAAARKLLEELIADPNESEDEKKKDQLALQSISSAQGEYAQSVAKIKQLETDKKVFRDAADELRFVNDFNTRYSHHQSFADFPKSLSFPLLITPVDVDEVTVRMDDNMDLGTIRRDAPPQDRVIRYQIYPVAASHRLVFTKRGYTTQTDDTVTHQTPEEVEIKVALKRQPDIKAQLPNAHFDGEPRFADGLLLAGTSDGALLEIDVKSNPPLVTRRYEIEQPLAAVEKQIVGPVFAWKDSEGSVFVYCTKAGYCAAVRRSTSGNTFENTWAKPKGKIDPTITSLQFPPCYFEHAGKPMIALLLDRRVLLIDAATGNVLPPMPSLELPVAATSGGTYFHGEGGKILVGGKDSNIHAVSLDGRTKPAAWGTQLNAIGAFVRIAPTVVDDKVVAAGNEGTLLVFSSTGEHLTPDRLAAGGISAKPLVDGSKLYYPCTGGPMHEGLTVVDLNTEKRITKNLTKTGVISTPAKIDKLHRLYFVTTDHRLTAVDADDVTKEYWSFEFDKTVSCPPIVDDRRVYILATDGTIYGFDEPR